MDVRISGEINLENKVAIITGGSRGIGRACVKTLAREKAKIAVCDVLPLNDTLQEVRSLGAEGLGRIVDVTDSLEIERFVKEVEEKFGTIDILVTCAGICPQRKPIWEVTNEEWNEVLTVNLNGTFYFIRAVYPYMKKTGYGKIVCMGSVAAKDGGTIAGPHYTATKGAIHSLVKWVAKVGAQDGIYVNAICPGPTDTDMLRGKISYDEYSKRIPLKRLGHPQDIAEPILLLASDASNYITGAILDVNGGLYMD